MLVDWLSVSFRVLGLFDPVPYQLTARWIIERRLGMASAGKRRIFAVERSAAKRRPLASMHCSCQ
jgi:hypothetical protein